MLLLDCEETIRLPAKKVGIPDVAHEAMLDRVCRDARDLIGAKYAVLCMNGKNGGASAFFTSGIDAAWLGKLAPPAIDQGLLGQVRAERRARRMRLPDGDPRSIGLPPGYPPLHACLMVPVVSLAHTYGWLCLADKLGAGEFSEEDEQLLTILAAQVGRIYENSSLYAELRQRAEQLQDEIAVRKRTADNLRAVSER